MSADLTTNDMHMTAALLQQQLEARYKPGCAIVAPLWDGPQVRVFSAILKFGVPPSDIIRSADALALAARADTCRVSQAPGQMLIEIAKPKEAREILRADRLEALTMPTRTAVPLGVSTGGKLVTLDIADDQQVHTLFGGATRSGKTSVVRWALYRLLAQNPPSQLRLLACDPKITHRTDGLRPFAYVPHLLHPIQSDAFEVMRVLTWLLMEMKRRENTGETTPRILLVLEEVKHFIDQNKDIAKALADLLQTGASWGIHVWAITQHPGAKSIGEGLPNLLVTVLGRVAREQNAYGAAGRAGSDAAALLGRGDMLYLGAGEMARFQAPFADGQQWVKIRRGLPGDLSPQLPRPDMFATGHAGKGGKAGNIITPADIERIKPGVLAGRGVEYVRQELRIGTDKARVLHSDIREGRA